MAIEKLKCYDFFFYPNGEYTTKSVWSSKLYTFDNDLQEVSTQIRIFGTDKQVDKTLDDYINITGLNLDESFTYQIEKEGTHFYNKETNKKIAKKLTDYKTLYNQSDKKALILRMV
jgi:hypothetical protein|tara:strand:- start:2573 stop:2920 length:348 start_codon:yes stop_codon:yes gene_type:complete